MKKPAATISCAILLIAGVAFAHAGEKHQGKHKEGAQMDKLHKMMPAYAQAQAAINEALEKGDKAAVEEQTGKILATLPDLKKAKPHKNPGALKTMRKIASAFEEEVKSTAALAKKGDFAGARASFVKAQKKCDECHAKFRD